MLKIPYPFIFDSSSKVLFLSPLFWIHKKEEEKKAKMEKKSMHVKEVEKKDVRKKSQKKKTQKIPERFTSSIFHWFSFLAKEFVN